MNPLAVCGMNKKGLPVRTSSFTKLRKLFAGLSLALVVSLCLPVSVPAQKRSWTTDVIDSAGSESSLAVDADGNLHVSYYYPVEGQLKYGFRPAKGKRWFTMGLDKGFGEFSTRIAIDPKGNPRICYSPNILKYASFDGRRWSVQQIDPGGGLVSYFCSLRIGPDGIPQVSWYVESGTYIRYASLKDGTWIAQTADAENKPGKWNSMVLDEKGLPHLSYVTIVKWQLRYSYYTGKAWIHTVVDSPDKSPQGEQRGMGNSLVLDVHGNPMISYYDIQSLKFAHFQDGKWKIETVEEFPSSGGLAGWKSYRSTLVLDHKGNPNIGFVTPSGLEHAWWNGKEWQKELIIGNLGNGALDCSMAIDANDNLYISYTDPADRSLKLAIGSAVPIQPAAPVSQSQALEPKP